MKSGFRVCESLRSRQGLGSKAQWLDEAFASQEIHRKPDKTATSELNGWPSCLKKMP